MRLTRLCLVRLGRRYGALHGLWQEWWDGTADGELTGYLRRGKPWAQA